MDIENLIKKSEKYAEEVRQAMPDTYNHGFEDGYVAALQDIKEHLIPPKTVR